MSKVYASIMRGLEEIQAHKEGKLHVNTSTLEIKPPPRCDDTIILEREKIVISS